MRFLEKEIREYELIFIISLIISILAIMASSFTNLWFWLPFLVVAVVCIRHFIQRTYLNFVIFDMALVLIYIAVGSYFFL